MTPTESTPETQASPVLPSVKWSPAQAGLIEQLEAVARLCELERIITDHPGDEFYRGAAAAFRQAADMARQCQETVKVSHEAGK